MYRIWYSTESFADYIIDNTLLSTLHPVKNKMFESDASKPNDFYKMPDHIRKILYLDAPDLIVEKDNEPIFSIEVTTEAGTGHNAFQRFARMAAAVENRVPAIYIYPEGAIITRRGEGSGWDVINPLIFKALDDVMSLHNIPALLFYFPSDDISVYRNNVLASPHFATKGLIFDSNIVDYPGCPDHTSLSMTSLFQTLNEIINLTETHGVKNARDHMLSNIVIRNKRTWMQTELHNKAIKPLDEMSPLSAVTCVPTRYLLNYLSRYERRPYVIGELLHSREYTYIYQINAKFRGDPYPGCLAAIDYMKCREGTTFEDRRYNLVLLWGRLVVDDEHQTICVIDEKGSTINDFFKDVQNCARHNLLVKDYADLRSFEIPRYMMQVRYGSTYSKVKHIRVFSYFADAILFPDGALWRDA